MRLAGFIKTDLIFTDLKSASKDAVLEEFAKSIANRTSNISEVDIINALKNREKLGSTGIEEGVAIPHGKIKNMDQIIIAVGRSLKGVDFDAHDHKLSHMFFVLLVPENETALHLKVMARITHLLRSKKLAEKIMSAKSEKEIYDILLTEDEQI